MIPNLSRFTSRKERPFSSNRCWPLKNKANSRKVKRRSRPTDTYLKHPRKSRITFAICPFGCSLTHPTLSAKSTLFTMHSTFHISLRGRGCCCCCVIDLTIDSCRPEMYRKCWFIFPPTISIYLSRIWWWGWWCCEWNESTFEQNCRGAAESSRRAMDVAKGVPTWIMAVYKDALELKCVRLSMCTLKCFAHILV